MAYELEILIIDGGDGTIKVSHHFFGHTEAEVYTYKREHEQSCEYFKSAIADGRVIEELAEIDDDDLPEAEEDEETEEEEEEA